MTFTVRDTAHLIAALTVLLIAAHAMGRLLVALKQPRVVGEILGGMLVGPTVLPVSVRMMLFPEAGPTRAALGAIYQLGMLLLMFSIGLELRMRRGPSEKATVLSVVVIGTVLPLLAGMAFFRAYDSATMLGVANNEVALEVVLACAIAVTSTPVIGRILGDLELLGTRFARIVLSSAVIEDGLLFLLLSFAFRLVGNDGSAEFGLSAWIGVPTWGQHVWHAAGPVLMLAMVLGGERSVSLAGWSTGAVRDAPLGILLVLMLSITGFAMLLGISPMLGAFAAGGLCGALDFGDGAARVEEAKNSFRAFGNAFFGPVYFALVGLRLDLARDLDFKMCVTVLVYASLAKLIAVFLGAKLAGEPRVWSWDLAIAMNARGAPGIALATAAYDVGVINERLQLTLILLALVTSSMAGSWLRRVATRIV